MSSKLSEMLDLPLLTVAQERRATPEQLFAHNIRFALHLASNFSRARGGLDEYFAAAVAALWISALKYEPRASNGARFTSYARWGIQKELHTTRRRLTQTIHIPRSAEQDRARMLAGTQYDDAKTYRLASLPTTTSIDTPFKEGGVDCPEFIDTASKTPAQLAEREALNTELQQLMETQLTGQQRDVLLRRLGLFSEPETLEAIAKDYSLTRERIRQIEFLALRRLRAAALKLKIDVDALRGL